MSVKGERQVSYLMNWQLWLDSGRDEDTSKRALFDRIETRETGLACTWPDPLKKLRVFVLRWCWMDWYWIQKRLRNGHTIHRPNDKLRSSPKSLLYATCLFTLPLRHDASSFEPNEIIFHHLLGFVPSSYRFTAFQHNHACIKSCYAFGQTNNRRSIKRFRIPNKSCREMALWIRPLGKHTNRSR